jgi:hypothetical protein
MYAAGLYETYWESDFEIVLGQIHVAWNECLPSLCRRSAVLGLLRQA